MDYFLKLSVKISLYTSQSSRKEVHVFPKVAKAKVWVEFREMRRNAQAAVTDLW